MFESEISFETYSVHYNTGCFSSSKCCNLYLWACVRACIVGPLTPFGIWSLKWQRPFWKATIKIAPDLKSMVTAGLASHLTLISLHLRGLLLGVKSTSYLSSAKSKRMADANQDTSCFAFRSFLFMARRLLFVLCCCCSRFPTSSECLIIFLCQQYAWRGVFFLREAPLWLLAATL